MNKIHVLFCFQSSSVQGRRTGYQRRAPSAPAVDTTEPEVQAIDLVADTEEAASSTAGITSDSDTPDAELALDVEFLNSICDDEDDFYCLDFQDEESNLFNIMSFSRSS